ncbi:proline dehydrogenase family protein [Niallia nealsonii]|uniref:proline dehydrogenase n=1 Tax=Niallia nealsonii TaxID=115979 RepID=A0A2N0YXL9_9BACI|nr:proline dehydrogenase family protein [Niallia nealsonii]PKG21995.1 proline dehydrogenase [Niallia nealsonii]
MEAVLRSMFQSIAKNAAANKLAKKYGLRFGAQRFVAGETVASAIECVKMLNAKKIAATLDHLGEFVFTEEEAKHSAGMCLLTLDYIYTTKVESHLSVKLTSLGLDINKELCMNNMRAILERAQQYDNFVRIDMEDFFHCEAAIEIYEELCKKYDNVGLVIQAYLYRTVEDMERLHQIKANLRLVKGAYKESPNVAFPEKMDVDENFKKIIQMQLLNRYYAAIATHDENIINFTKKLVSDHQIQKNMFEFQMLYGIRVDLQNKLVEEGYKVRVYVPYGVDWFGYFMRRLAERPANSWFVLKNLFK